MENIVVVICIFIAVAVLKIIFKIDLKKAKEMQDDKK